MTTLSRALPGDPPADQAVARMVRVDHAGEYGATRIYAGQLAVLRNSDKADLIRHMQAQEQAHLTTFNGLIARRRVRPTALLPFWHLAGFALGAVTAAMGGTRGNGLHRRGGGSDRRTLQRADRRTR